MPILSVQCPNNLARLNLTIWTAASYWPQVVPGALLVSLSCTLVYGILVSADAKDVRPPIADPANAATAGR
jgi:hypothetical protein